MTEPSNSPGLYVGAQLDRTPGRKYTGTLRFAELVLRAPLPKPGTLASARRELPEGFTLAIRAPRSAVVSSQGALRVDAQLEASLAWLLAAADASQARAVVIPTPVDLTPGARSRDLLRAYVARLPRVPGRLYVWSPTGVWEPEDSHAMCAELDLICGFDPLESPRPPGPIAYATLRALGHRSGFSVSALSDALTRLVTPETTEAFLSVDAAKGFDVAKRIQQLLAAAESEALAEQPMRRRGYSGVAVGHDDADEDLDDEDLDDEDAEGDLGGDDEGSDDEGSDEADDEAGDDDADDEGSDAADDEDDAGGDKPKLRARGDAEDP